jgi:succinoglycan biosynthesis protein ExoA
MQERGDRPVVTDVAAETGFGRPSQDDEDLVTVIVPARNEKDSVVACLESILAQRYRNLEVVVVDGGSLDRTSDEVRRVRQRDPRIRLLPIQDGGIPHSLNEGLRAARGRWIVRVDAHATVPRHYVDTLVGHLRTGRWGGVGGRKEAVGDDAVGRAIAAALGSRFGVGNSVYHYGVRSVLVDHVPFGAYPTALLRQIGGWDEALESNEDFELDYRIRRSGYELLFDPAVSIAWRSRSDIPALFRQYRRYGRGKADVVRLHPASMQPRHAAAPALVALLAVAGPLSVRHPLVTAALVAPYVVGVLGATATVFRRDRDTAAAPFVPAAFLAMHIGWGIGFWERIFSRSVRSCVLRADLRRIRAHEPSKYRVCGHPAHG